MDRLKLISGPLALDLVPALGGAMTSMRWRHPDGHEIDLFRPIIGDAAEIRDVELSCAFPLTPFSNRVRHGKFSYQGTNITLPQNTSGPHVEHGHGWQRPWQVLSADMRHTVLRYQHDADSWPYNYSVEQRIRMTNGRLEVELCTKNCSDHVMPYGFGLHPYFPRTQDCRIFAQVTGMWDNDDEIMPIRHLRDHIKLDCDAGLRIEGSNLDNVFTGWTGRAEIHWPEYATKLVIKTHGPLKFLVVYSPPNENYFCVEPVSNCTDAFNLHSLGMQGTGILEIEPEETISAKICFSPRPIN